MNIPCNTVLDLLPVQDGVASEESRQLVLRHIETCPDCKKAADTELLNAADNMQDEKIIHRIKKRLLLFGSLLLLFGIMFGVFLTSSAGVFYNFLLMPLIGALGYFIIRKKKIILPVGVFAVSYIGVFIQCLADASWEFQGEFIIMPLFYCGIYTVLCMAGFAVAALLHFAFKKEEK